MKAFIYQGKTYLRAIPGKNLFKSTMVHEVVNRGDIFALEVETQRLTIIPGSAQVEHIDTHLVHDWAITYDQEVNGLIRD